VRWYGALIKRFASCLLIIAQHLLIRCLKRAGLTRRIHLPLLDLRLTLFALLPLNVLNITRLPVRRERLIDKVAAAAARIAACRRILRISFLLLTLLLPLLLTLLTLLLPLLLTLLTLLLPLLLTLLTLLLPLLLTLLTLLLPLLLTLLTLLLPLLPLLLLTLLLLTLLLLTLLLPLLLTLLTLLLPLLLTLLTLLLPLLLTLLTLLLPLLLTLLTLLLPLLLTLLTLLLPLLPLLLLTLLLLTLLLLTLLLPLLLLRLLRLLLPGLGNRLALFLDLRNRLLRRLLRRLLLLRLLHALRCLVERLLRLLDIVLLQGIRRLLQRLGGLRRALLQLLRLLAQLLRQLRALFRSHVLDLLRQLLQRILRLIQRRASALLLIFQRLKIASKLLQGGALRFGVGREALLEARFRRREIGERFFTVAGVLFQASLQLRQFGIQRSALFRSEHLVLRQFLAQLCDLRRRLLRRFTDGSALFQRLILRVGRHDERKRGNNQHKRDHQRSAVDLERHQTRIEGCGKRIRIALLQLDQRRAFGAPTEFERRRQAFARIEQRIDPLRDPQRRQRTQDQMPDDRQRPQCQRRQRDPDQPGDGPQTPRDLYQQRQQRSDPQRAAGEPEGITQP
jgi:hypothetical protein